MKHLITLLLCLWLVPALALAQDATATNPQATGGTAEQTPPPTGDAMAALEKDVANYMDNLAPEGPLAGKTGAGHQAWMMVCTALVLFMTLPGLALFYGGLVRRKNVLSVLAQCLGITGLVAILWWAFGYSGVFSTSGDILGGLYGAMDKAFFAGVGSTPNTGYSAWASETVFACFQLTFAIITPALIVGAVAERMKFSAVMLFTALWMMVVYFPLAHMVWGGTGLMNGVWNADAKITAIDFAGGTVVHMSSGWSALALCLLLGKRKGYGKQPMAPHSMVLCMVGTGMLWVGWYGFNAGSAMGADGIAANAFATTTFAAAVACFTWAVLEWLLKGKPSVLGFCSGAVAGLVVITPAAGFVSIGNAVLIGLLAGAIPFFFVAYLKAKLGFDDALDTFGIHGIGGTLGAILTGIFADGAVNSNLVAEGVAGKNGLKKLVEEGGLVGPQIYAGLITIAFAVVATTVIAFLIKFTIGLRASEEVETQGLDLAEHGEEGYHGA